VNLGAARAAVFAAARLDLHVQDALHAQAHEELAVGALRVERHDHAVGGLQPRLEAIHELRVVRRAELLLALGQHHQVHRQRAVHRDDRLDRVQERALRALLVGRAARHQRGTQRRLHQVAGERRRLPVVLLDRLHVVHHVDQHGALGARVVITPHAGMPVGRHHLGLGKAERLEVSPQQLRHLRNTVVLRTDRALPHPALQRLDVALQAGVDVRIHGRMLAGIGRDARRVEGLVGGDFELRADGRVRKEGGRGDGEGEQGGQDTQAHETGLLASGGLLMGTLPISHCDIGNVPK
jgi:hypothetical protein